MGAVLTGPGLLLLWKARHKPTPQRSLTHYSFSHHQDANYIPTPNPASSFSAPSNSAHSNRTHHLASKPVFSGTTTQVETGVVLIPTFPPPQRPSNPFTLLVQALVISCLAQDTFLTGPRTNPSSPAQAGRVL